MESGQKETTDEDAGGDQNLEALVASLSAAIEKLNRRIDMAAKRFAELKAIVEENHTECVEAADELERSLEEGIQNAHEAVQNVDDRVDDLEEAMQLHVQDLTNQINLL